MWWKSHTIFHYYLCRSDSGGMEIYHGKICFWGGGVDSQSVMEFGTPDNVERQMRERNAIFSPGGGFVFSVVHDIQPTVPLENVKRIIDVMKCGM